MDRIDIQIHVPRVDYEKLTDKRDGESSADIRARVEASRQIQLKRFEGLDIHSNADMRPAQVTEFCVLEESAETLMRSAMRQMQLTASAYHRVLKLSRTIADLAGEDVIQIPHLAEALNYRTKLDVM